MATFDEQALMARKHEFIWRVEQAMIKAAVAVSTESKPDYRRANYASQVLNNPDYYAPKWSLAVATNGSIDDKSKDNDIEFTVNSMFNAFAGAYEKTEPVVVTTSEVEPIKLPPPATPMTVEEEPEPEQEKVSWWRKLFG